MKPKIRCHTIALRIVWHFLYPNDEIAIIKIVRKEKI